MNLSQLSDSDLLALKKRDFSALSDEGLLTLKRMQGGSAPEPKPEPIPERTWGEAVTDFGAGVVSGAGSLAALPGQIYGLATGDFDNASTRAGAAVREYGEQFMSPALQAKKAELERKAALAAENGVIDEFITYAKETVTDPALLSYLLAEFIPSVVGGFGAGAVARGAVSGAARLTGKELAEGAAARAGTRAARGFGAAVEGGGAAEETYREALDILAKQGVTGPEAEAIALEKARIAGGITGVTTGATSYLGGLEKVMGGEKGVGSKLATAGGEALQGLAEGFTTTVPQNVTLQGLDPAIKTFRNTGSAAAAEAIGGGIAGLALGGENADLAQSPAKDRPLTERERNAQLIEQARRQAQQGVKDRADAKKGVPIPVAVPPSEDLPQGQLFPLDETTRKKLDAEDAARFQARDAEPVPPVEAKDKRQMGLDFDLSPAEDATRGADITEKVKTFTELEGMPQTARTRGIKEKLRAQLVDEFQSITPDEGADFKNDEDYITQAVYDNYGAIDLEGSLGKVIADAAKLKRAKRKAQADSERQDARNAKSKAFTATQEEDAQGQMGLFPDERPSYGEQVEVPYTYTLAGQDTPDPQTGARLLYRDRRAMPEGSQGEGGSSPRGAKTFKNALRVKTLDEARQRLQIPDADDQQTLRAARGFGYDAVITNREIYDFQKAAKMKAEPETGITNAQGVIDPDKFYKATGIARGDDNDTTSIRNPASIEGINLRTEEGRDRLLGLVNRYVGGRESKVKAAVTKLLSPFREEGQTADWVSDPDYMNKVEAKYMSPQNRFNRTQQGYAKTQFRDPATKQIDMERKLNADTPLTEADVAYIAGNKGVFNSDNAPRVNEQLIGRTPREIMEDMRAGTLNLLGMPNQKAWTRKLIEEPFEDDTVAPAPPTPDEEDTNVSDVAPNPDDGGGSDTDGGAGGNVPPDGDKPDTDTSPVGDEPARGGVGDGGVDTGDTGDGSPVEPDSLAPKRKKRKSRAKPVVQKSPSQEQIEQEKAATAAEAEKATAAGAWVESSASQPGATWSDLSPELQEVWMESPRSEKDAENILKQHTADLLKRVAVKIITSKGKAKTIDIFAKAAITDTLDVRGKSIYPKGGRRLVSIPVAELERLNPKSRSAPVPPALLQEILQDGVASLPTMTLNVRDGVATATSDLVDLSPYIALMKSMRYESMPVLLDAGAFQWGAEMPSGEYYPTVLRTNTDSSAELPFLVSQETAAEPYLKEKPVPADFVQGVFLDTRLSGIAFDVTAQFRALLGKSPDAPLTVAEVKDNTTALVAYGKTLGVSKPLVRTTRASVLAPTVKMPDASAPAIERPVTEQDIARAQEMLRAGNTATQTLTLLKLYPSGKGLMSVTTKSPYSVQFAGVYPFEIQPDGTLTYKKRDYLGLSPKSNADSIFSTTAEVTQAIADTKALMVDGVPDGVLERGPFHGKAQTTVATRSIPPAVVELVKELKAALRIDMPVFLSTNDDLTADEYNLRGEFALFAEPIGSADGMANLISVNGKSFATIKLNTELVGKDVDPEYLLETVAHEFGHLIDYVAFKSASPAVQAKVIAAYKAWALRNKDKTYGEVIRTLRNKSTVASYAEQVALKNPKIWNTPIEKLTSRDYFLSFSEWFADNVGRWVTSKDKAPQTAVEKFFKSVADTYKKAVAIFYKGRDAFAPDEAVVEFLNERSLGTWIRAEDAPTRTGKDRANLPFGWASTNTIDDVIPEDLQETIRNKAGQYADDYKIKRIEYPSAFSRARQFVREAWASERGMVDALRTVAVDKFAAAEGVIVEKFGAKLKDEFDRLTPIYQLREAEDASRLIDAFNRFGRIELDVNGNVQITGDKSRSMSALLERIAQRAKDDGVTADKVFKEVSDYLKALRNKDLIEEQAQMQATVARLRTQGKKIEAKALEQRIIKIEDDWDLGTTEEVIDRFKNDALFSDAQDIVRSMLDNLLDFQLATGVLTKEAYKEFKGRRNFVPFFREFDPAVEGNKMKGGLVSRGLSRVAEIPKFKGSTTRDTQPILDNLLKLNAHMISAGLRNSAAANLAYNLEAAEAARVVDSKREAESLRKEGVPVESFKIDGEEVYLAIKDPFVARAFAEFAPPKFGFWQSMLRDTARLFRGFITTMPPFAVKQVVLDIYRGYANSGIQNGISFGTKVAKNLLPAWRETYTQKFKKGGKFEALLKKGVIGAYDLIESDPGQELRIRTGIEKEGAFKKVIRLFEAFTLASDLSVRAAIYEQALIENGQDEVDAAYRAREFINFKRRGASTALDTLIPLIPFFNAYLQGTDILVRNLSQAAGSSRERMTSTGKDVAAARARLRNNLGVLATMSLMYALMMQDDEEYKNAPLYVKNGNFLFGGFQIPVPPELAFVTKTLPEMLVNIVANEGTDREQTVLKVLKEHLMLATDTYVFGGGNPASLIPPYVKVPLELLTNHNVFTGRDVNPSSARSDIAAFRQYGASTGEVYKKIAEMFMDTPGLKEISPYYMEHTVRGLLGGLGGIMTNVADYLLMGSDRTAKNWSDVPMAELFVPKSVGGLPKDVFFKMRSRVLEVSNTLSNLEKSAPEKVPAYLENNASLLNGVAYMNHKTEVLSEYRALKNRIKEDPNYTPQERRDLINQLERDEATILSDVFEMAKVLGLN